MASGCWLMIVIARDIIISVNQLNVNVNVLFYFFLACSDKCIKFAVRQFIFLFLRKKTTKQKYMNRLSDHTLFACLHRTDTVQRAHI